jgi:hypothetical protein
LAAAARSRCLLWRRRVRCGHALGAGGVASAAAAAARAGVYACVCVCVLFPSRQCGCRPYEVSGLSRTSNNDSNKTVRVRSRRAQRTALHAAWLPCHAALVGRHCAAMQGSAKGAHVVQHRQCSMRSHMIYQRLHCIRETIEDHLHCCVFRTTAADANSRTRRRSAIPMLAHANDCKCLLSQSASVRRRLAARVCDATVTAAVCGGACLKALPTHAA